MVSHCHHQQRQERKIMNYQVIGIGTEIYVADENGKTISGPYKNRKSAVGRISDLKKKEISAGVHGNLVTPAVQKLAASSEYGKSRPFTVETNPLAAGMNNLDVSGFKITAIGGNPISRPRGVYPAVSKHAYQR